MPRRNRNANGGAVDPDDLAAEARHLATELGQSDRIKNVLDWVDSWHTEIKPVPPACIACQVNPATEGDYCLLCKGQIIMSARKTTVKRR